MKPKFKSGNFGTGKVWMLLQDIISLLVVVELKNKSHANTSSTFLVAYVK